MVRYSWRLSALLLLLSGPAAAEPPQLGLPLDCPSDESCYVQNYVDADPGPGARDQRCTALTYDGHKGVDIALPTMAALRQGVEVKAAAAGRVKALRDGMADRVMDDPNDPALKGREAGNAVIVEHGDGWETQYSHLHQGSVAVAVGQEVAAGQRLGEVGLSGRTVFPHLELTLRHNGETVDPYTGLPPGAGCGAAGTPLWTAAALERLAYRPAGLLDSGFLGRVPEAETAWSGGYRGALPAAGDPVLVFWVSGWGVAAGDLESLRLFGPDGALLAEHEEANPKTQARFFRFIGLKRRGADWPPGRYRAVFRLRRGEELLLDATREATISSR